MADTTFETLKSGALTFAKIIPNHSIDVEQLRDVDGVIIEYSDQASVLGLIKKIRAHDDEAIYLMPVILNKFYREANQNIAMLADMTVNNLSDLEQVRDVSNEILERI